MSVNLQEDSAGSDEILAAIAARLPPLIPFTPAGTGAVETTTEEKARRSVDLLDFIPLAEHAAIKAGTTTTDVTAYIQAALNAIPSTGGQLRLPPGTYPITDDILIRKSNVRLCGDGAGMVTIKIKTSWTAPPLVSSIHSMVNLLAQSLVTGAEGTRISNIEISGIRFLGIRPSAGTNLSPKAICGNFADNVWVHHCIFEEIEGEVIAGGGTPNGRSWKIVDNHFVNCGGTVDASEQTCVNANFDCSLINNNTFENVSSAISLYGRDSAAVGNVIVGFTSWGIKIGESADQGVGATISDNVIYTVANTTHVVQGIVISGSGAGTGAARYVTVAGNTIGIKTVASTFGNPIGISTGQSSVGANHGIRISSNVIVMDMNSIATAVFGCLVLGTPSTVEINDNTFRFINVNDAAYHAGIQARAISSRTMNIQACNNRAYGMGAVSGFPFDFQRSGTGVAIICALNNLSDAGSHIYDGTAYSRPNTPVSFVSVTGTTGDGVVSTPAATVVGTLTQSPAASATPAVIGQMLFEATSNTSVTMKLKGSDGTVRSVVLTLA